MMKALYTFNTQKYCFFLLNQNKFAIKYNILSSFNN